MGYATRYANNLANEYASHIYTGDQDLLREQLMWKLGAQSRMVNCQPNQPVCDLDSDFLYDGTFHQPKIPTISTFTTGTLGSLDGLDPANLTDTGDPIAYTTALPYRPYNYTAYTNLGQYAYLPDPTPDFGGVWRYQNKEELYLSGSATITDEPSITTYVWDVSGSHNYCPRQFNGSPNFKQFSIPNISFDFIRDHGFGWYYYHNFTYYQYGLSMGGVFATTSSDLWDYNFIFARFGINDKPIYANFINDPRYALMQYFNKIRQSFVDENCNGSGAATGANLTNRRKLFDGTYGDSNQQFLSASIDSIYMNASFTPQGEINNSLLTDAINVFPYVYHRQTSDGMLGYEDDFANSDAMPYLRNF